MLFVIEAVVACLVFTLLVAIATHQRMAAHSAAPLLAADDPAGISYRRKMAAGSVRAAVCGLLRPGESMHSPDSTEM